MRFFLPIKTMRYEVETEIHGYHYSNTRIPSMGTRIENVENGDEFKLRVQRLNVLLILAWQLISRFTL